MNEPNSSFVGPNEIELAAAGRNRKPLIAYYFFGRLAESGATFTIDELIGHGRGQQSLAGCMKRN